MLLMKANITSYSLINLTFLGCLVLGFPGGFLTGADRRCAASEYGVRGGPYGHLQTNAHYHINDSTIYDISMQWAVIAWLEKNALSTLLNPMGDVHVTKVLNRCILQYIWNRVTAVWLEYFLAVSTWRLKRCVRTGPAKECTDREYPFSLAGPLRACTFWPSSRTERCSDAKYMLTQVRQNGRLLLNIDLKISYSGWLIMTCLPLGVPQGAKGQESHYGILLDSTLCWLVKLNL